LLDELGREMELLGLRTSHAIAYCAGYHVARTIREFGVYDSDVAMDSGWLEPLVQSEPRVGFLKPLAAAAN
jgi:hypothetical protein